MNGPVEGETVAGKTDDWRRLERTLDALERELAEVEVDIEEADALLRGAPELLGPVCRRLVEAEDELARLEDLRLEALAGLRLRDATLASVGRDAPPAVAARLERRGRSLRALTDRLAARAPDVAARALRYAQGSRRLSDDL